MPTFSLVACAIATFIWVDGKMISGKFPGVVVFVFHLFFHFCLLSACLGKIYNFWKVWSCLRSPTSVHVFGTHRCLNNLNATFVLPATADEVILSH